MYIILFGTDEKDERTKKTNIVSKHLYLNNNIQFSRIYGNCNYK